MAGYFADFPIGTKVAMAAILLISIIRISISKGQKGGIGAGILIGVFMEGFIESYGWEHRVNQLVVIILHIISYLFIIAICGFLFTKSQELISESKKGVGSIILAVFLRIISVAGFSLLLFGLISRVGNGGFIVF